MPEVATCIICSGQKWEIHKNKIKCANCSFEHELESSELAVDLVDVIKELVINTTKEVG